MPAHSYIYIHTHSDTYSCTCTVVCTYRHIHTCIHSYVHRPHTCTLVDMHTHTLIHECRHTHKYIHRIRMFLLKIMGTRPPPRSLPCLDVTLQTLTSRWGSDPPNLGWLWGFLGRVLGGGQSDERLYQPQDSPTSPPSLSGNPAMPCGQARQAGWG